MKCPTTMPPLPRSKIDRINIHDKDYRCDSWDDPDFYGTNSLSFKIHVHNPTKQVDEIMKLPSSPSPVLKMSTPTLVVPVTITSTRIKADDVSKTKHLCHRDKKNELLIFFSFTTSNRTSNTSPHKQR